MPVTTPAPAAALAAAFQFAVCACTWARRGLVFARSPFQSKAFPSGRTLRFKGLVEPALDGLGLPCVQGAGDGQPDACGSGGIGERQ